MSASNGQSASNMPTGDRATRQPKRKGAPGGKLSVADALVVIGRGPDVELFHDADGTSWATVTRDGIATTTPVSRGGLGLWLRHRWYETAGKGVSDGDMKTALSTLHAIAVCTGDRRAVFSRLGHEGRGAMRRLVLDLANDQGHAVLVTPLGWTITTDPPVRMHRPSGMQPLPMPDRDNDGIAPLWDVLNVPPGDRVLVAAWLLATLHPTGPYPALFLHGEQGSAKTCCAELVRAVVDPNRVPLRCEPRDEDALAIAAQNSLIYGLDNLSHVDQRLSDLLCRLMTGAGLSKRKLYTDGEEVLMQFRRPVLATGIPDLATAGDLADRTISLHLPVIPDSERRMEEEVKAEFARIHAGLLGALLDAAVAALRGAIKGRPKHLSRNADFEAWAVAGLPALGFDADDFRARYRDNRSAAAGAVVDSSPVASALTGFLEQGTVALPGPIAFWEGTATELLTLLLAQASDGGRSRGWPQSPRGLTGTLRRLAPALRKACGIEVNFSPRSHGKTRSLVRITHDAETHATSATHATDDGIPL